MHWRCTNVYFHYPHIVHSCTVAAQICIIVICILRDAHSWIIAVQIWGICNYLHIVYSCKSPAQMCTFTIYNYIVHSCIVAAQICIIIICILCNVHPCIGAVTNLYFHFLQIVHSCIIGYCCKNLYYNYLHIVHSWIDAAHICTFIFYILCIHVLVMHKFVLHFLQIVHSCIIPAEICTVSIYILCLHKFVL